MTRPIILLRVAALVTLIAAPVLAQDAPMPIAPASAAQPTDLNGKAEPAQPMPIAPSSPEAVLPAGTAAPEGISAGTSAPKTYGDSDADYDAFTHHVGATFGPSHIEIRDQAILDLPEGFIWVPRKPAAMIMQKLGNAVGDSFVGLILPQKNDHWFISAVYDPAGHIDDTKSWDADQLLKQIRDGNEMQNAERRQHGLPVTDVVGWVEAPRYDAATHRLVWSLAEHTANGGNDAENGVNYMTMVLGREGYISMTTVTNLSAIDMLKPVANDMLSRVSFTPGHGYGDFDSKTDRIATYGIAGLISGNNGPTQFIWTDYVIPMLMIVLIIAVVAGVARRRNASDNDVDDDGDAPQSGLHAHSQTVTPREPPENASPELPPSMPPPGFRRNDPPTDL